jgi:hypothetical protein
MIDYRTERIHDEDLRVAKKSSHTCGAALRSLIKYQKVKGSLSTKQRRFFFFLLILIYAAEGQQRKASE